MKRLLLVLLLAALASACIHPWVGRPVAQLEKEYGSPLSILNRGNDRVYYYPDFLAGRGQMTFTVDRRGIIKSWCATADVPSVFVDDLSGNPGDVPVGTVSNGRSSPDGNRVGVNGPNGGLGGNRAGGFAPSPACR